jgi:hypothetical protein
MSHSALWSMGSARLSCRLKPAQQEKQAAKRWRQRQLYPIRNRPVREGQLDPIGEAAC